MKIKHSLVLVLALTIAPILISCQQNETGAVAQKTINTQPETAPAPTATKPEPSPFILSASIQDIMSSIIDPAADYLWDSVSVVGTKEGIVEHRPRTDADWQEVRRKAITLMEAGNLLAMKGRRVVAEGRQLEDEGLEGNLTSAQIQKLLDTDHASFVAFAHALNNAAAEALKAIEKRDVDAFLEAGGTLDAACEACHLRYWYPGQGVPTD